MQATHDSKINEIPQKVEKRGDFPPSPDGSLGVLLLHGFTSALSCVDGILPSFDAMHIPYEMPVLRGHNATPEALKGVKAEDWYEDAQYHFLLRKHIFMKKPFIYPQNYNKLEVRKGNLEGFMSSSHIENVNS